MNAVGIDVSKGKSTNHLTPSKITIRTGAVKKAITTVPKKPSRYIIPQKTL